ncbi:hypothetical protein [Streptomyces sp. NPDC088785]|uniref:hypothetical protein n=1 Tax=Streptomyces sp. NPDC088785 TaxID=3365897 RepID=UPI0037FA56E7
MGELLERDGVVKTNNRAGDYAAEIRRRNPLRREMTPRIESPHTGLLTNVSAYPCRWRAARGSQRQLAAHPKRTAKKVDEWGQAASGDSS